MAHRNTIGFLAVFLLLSFSCMRDRPEEFPEELIWNPELAFPLGIDTFAMNAESGFDTTLFALDSLERPLWVSQLEVVMEGQAAFDLDMLGVPVEDIRRIMFRVNLYNDFPHQVAVQAYFATWDSTLIDSLFQEGPLLLPPGRPRGTGAEVDASYTRKDAHFTEDDLLALDDSEVIYLRAVVATPEVDSTLYDFYRDYLLVVDVGLLGEMMYRF